MGSTDDKVSKFPEWKLKDTNEWNLHPPNQYIVAGLFDNSGSPSLFNTTQAKSKIDMQHASRFQGGNKRYNKN